MVLIMKMQNSCEKYGTEDVEDGSPPGDIFLRNFYRYIDLLDEPQEYLFSWKFNSQ